GLRADTLSQDPYGSLYLSASHSATLTATSSTLSPWSLLAYSTASLRLWKSPLVASSAYKGMIRRATSIARKNIERRRYPIVVLLIFLSACCTSSRHDATAYFPPLTA